MSQLDRIERLLTELVRESRAARIRAEKERFGLEMQESSMSSEGREAALRHHERRLAHIGRGDAVIET
jgi:hypothetical protein